MEGLGLKSKYYCCPYCDYSVASDSPICKQCGLEMSMDGIEELAKSEEAKDLAIEDAGKLKIYSGLFYIWSIYLLITYILLVDDLTITLFQWGVGLIAMIVQFIKWQLKHSETCLEFDGLTEATKQRDKAISTVIGLVFVCAILVWFKL